MKRSLLSIKKVVRAVFKKNVMDEKACLKRMACWLLVCKVCVGLGELLGQLAGAACAAIAVVVGSEVGVLVKVDEGLRVRAAAWGCCWTRHEGDGLWGFTWHEGVGVASAGRDLGWLVRHRRRGAARCMWFGRDQDCWAWLGWFVGRVVLLLDEREKAS